MILLEVSLMNMHLPHERRYLHYASRNIMLHSGQLPSSNLDACMQNKFAQAIGQHLFKWFILIHPCTIRRQFTMFPLRFAFCSSSSSYLSLMQKSRNDIIALKYTLYASCNNCIERIKIHFDRAMCMYT